MTTLKAMKAAIDIPKVSKKPLLPNVQTAS